MYSISISVLSKLSIFFSLIQQQMDISVVNNNSIWWSSSNAVSLFLCFFCLFSFFLLFCILIRLVQLQGLKRSVPAHLFRNPIPPCHNAASDSIATPPLFSSIWHSVSAWWVCCFRRCSWTRGGCLPILAHVLRVITRWQITSEDYRSLGRGYEYLPHCALPSTSSARCLPSQSSVPWDTIVCHRLGNCRRERKPNTPTRDTDQSHEGLSSTRTSAIAAARVVWGFRCLHQAVAARLVAFHGRGQAEPFLYTGLVGAAERGAFLLVGRLWCKDTARYNGGSYHASGAEGEIVTEKEHSQRGNSQNDEDGAEKEGCERIGRCEIEPKRKECTVLF